jgi:hypothetical protein
LAAQKTFDLFIPHVTCPASRILCLMSASHSHNTSSLPL